MSVPGPRVLDLSHPLSDTMPVYPGSRPPRIRRTSTVAERGFAETSLGFLSHTGTHVDAPAHMRAGGATLDRLPVETFVGTACVLDATGAARLDRAFLEAHAELVAGCAFLLFHTGWDRHWGRPAYLEGFPVLTPEGARWVAAQGLAGVGADTISPDPVGSRDFPIHHILFGAGLLVYENLTGLGPLAGRRCHFAGLPLPYAEADGCPVRAVAMVDPGEAPATRASAS